MLTEAIQCPLCHGLKKRHLMRKYELDIVRCRSCNLVYVNPRPIKAYGLHRYSDDYFRDEYLRAYCFDGQGADLSPLARRFVPLLARIGEERQPPGIFLDVGAGAGFALAFARDAGWTPVGTEIIPAAIEYGRKSLGLDMRMVPAEKLDFEADSVDVVSMFDVIEHLYDPFGVLRNILNFMKKGGLLVIVTPNYRAISRLALGRSWAVFSPAEHLFFFTPKTLTALLIKVGFSEVRILAHQPGFDVFETMNASHTHSPNSMRVWLYSLVVSLVGGRCVDRVQRLHRADSLLAIARKAE